MTLFHFLVGSGPIKLRLKFRAHSATDALNRMNDFFNDLKIIDAYCGSNAEDQENAQAKTLAGRVYYPELRRKKLFATPVLATALNAEPLLISEASTESTPEDVHIANPEAKAAKLPKTVKAGLPPRMRKKRESKKAATASEPTAQAEGANEPTT